MLLYFGLGLRDYSGKPVAAGRGRPAWEFQAVLSGAIARMEPGKAEKPVFRERSLWISQPGAAHGWSGRRSAEAEIVVFHFGYVPKVLELMLRDREHHRIELDDSEATRIREHARGVARYWRQPSPGMLLAAEAALADLSLMIYEDLADDANADARTGAREVGRALQIYSQRMGSNPSLASVAEEVGVSVAHLRRLFHAHMGCGPKAAFAQLRERRIMELLTDTEGSLETIAEQTGFSESSALSRAFRTRFGYPPSQLRMRRAEH